MKKITALLILVLVSLQSMAQERYFGKKIESSGAITMRELIEKTNDGKDIPHVKITGVVEEVCQAKGCWITLPKGDGTSMRVKFKDYGFFLPKDCAGKTVILEGKAFFRNVSVEELKHYAEDAGKSKEEIEAIKEGGRF
jgi:hypothetical protein